MQDPSAIDSGNSCFRTVLRWGLSLTLMCAFAMPVRATDQIDPWEGLNRKTHAFNDFLDRRFLRPIAKGYTHLMPRFARRGIHNAMVNIGTPAVALNQLLQGKGGRALSDSGRFLVNSTLGVGGLFDPASQMGLAAHEENFGQTFRRWGLGNGPYIVVPLRGPATITTGFGMILDTFSNPIRHIDDVSLRNSLSGLSVVNLRAELLGAEALLTGDKYLFLRDAYLQRTEFLVFDGELEEDPFLDDFDEDFDDEYVETPETSGETP